MVIATREFTYDADGVESAAYLAWDAAIGVPLAGILVTPTVRGPTAFEHDRARRLADLGYAALVIDFYGIEARSSPGADMFALMGALNADRRLLQARMGIALDVLNGLPETDDAKTGAIGFCFGGKAVLDLARTRTDVSMVAAFHGLFDPPPFDTLDHVTSKILALHGWDDPLAPPDAVLAFTREFTAKGADWQLHAYGHTGHAFTNPGANDREHHMFYVRDADERSWETLERFFAEKFG